MKTRVMLVDDHILVRMGLTCALNSQPDMQVVGEAEDGDEAVDVYGSCEPDIVVMDMRMAKVDGIETISRLRSKFGPVRVLILTHYGTGDEVAAAMQAGALGFLSKDTSCEELFIAVQKVSNGEEYFSPEVASRLAGRISSQLSSRELEVLSLIGQGLSNKDVAQKLDLAEATVKAHFTKVLVKLGVSDRTQAILAGIKRGIIHIQ